MSDKEKKYDKERKRELNWNDIPHGSYLGGPNGSDAGGPANILDFVNQDDYSSWPKL